MQCDTKAENKRWAVSVLAKVKHEIQIKKEKKYCILASGWNFQRSAT